MTRVEWDANSQRLYEMGLDRGVVYLSSPIGGAAGGLSGYAPWNGLKSVDYAPERESTPYYMDGVKYLDRQTFGDFSATIKAITYPDVLEKALGTVEIAPGVFAEDQRIGTFGLTYRTLVGNEIDGTDHAYKLHLIWNATALQDTFTVESLNDQANPTEFSWTIRAIPVATEGLRPLAHLTIRSDKANPENLLGLEDTLYGTDSSLPSLPSLQNVIDILS